MRSCIGYQDMISFVTSHLSIFHVHAGSRLWEQLGTYAEFSYAKVLSEPNQVFAAAFHYGIYEAIDGAFWLLEDF